MSTDVTKTDSSKFLNFQDAKVQTLTMEQLHKTHKETNVYGKPLLGIHHFELLDDVMESCERAGFHPEVYDLFAAHNNDRQSPGVVLLPQVEVEYGERAIEAHILRRVFANIRLTDMDDDTYTTNFSVAFHQKGIQIGFGNNVKICHNQCMLNADLYAATYSEQGRSGNKYEIGQMLQMVDDWLAKAPTYIQGDRDKIKRMKEIEVRPQKAFELIGMLTSTRVAHDTKNKRIHRNMVYPLNQAQICDFTERLMVKFDEQQQLNLWDIYDTATELYKANTMDIPGILPQNRAFVRMLEENFPI